MKSLEYHRLLRFSRAKTLRPTSASFKLSKRSAKGQGAGVGRTDLLHGGIISNIGKIRYIKP